MADPGSNALLLLISGPSGGGKTTLCQHLLAARPALTRAVTCTTRPPRPGERDGVDYYFLDDATFEQRVAAGAFVEHATVYGRRYGTLKSELLVKVRLGRDVLLSVDVQGVASIRAQAQRDPELRRAMALVFLTPPSLAELEARLRRRGSDAPEVIAHRLRVARQEVTEWTHFDYLLLSTTVAEDLRRMLVIYEAEQMRQARATLPDGLRVHPEA